VYVGSRSTPDDESATAFALELRLVGQRPDYHASRLRLAPTTEKRYRGSSNGSVDQEYI
jgi:hypothetical protein